MVKFRATIKEAVENWNKNNPDKRELTMTALAEKLECTKQWLSQINTVLNKSLVVHAQVIFLNDDKETIKKNWEKYKELRNVKFIQRFDKMTVELGCEIWDLIKKIEE